MTAIAIKRQSIVPAATGLPGGSVRTLSKRKAAPVMSEQTRRTFQMISAPENAHLFTAQAALKAFATVKI